jgi:hypothetical protein
VTDEPSEGPEPAPIADPSAALREAVGIAAGAVGEAPPPTGESNPYGKVEESDPDTDSELALPGPSRRRTVVIATASILGGLLVAMFVFLGRANAERYVIVCSTDRVSAEQGRAFPPWGSHPLSGPEWKPIALPQDAECRAQETDDPDELTRWYLGLLMDRASTTLSSRDLLETIALPAAGSASAGPNPLDLAEEQLGQALLLARAPEHRDQRKEIERLQGDVAYWRASLRLRDASTALADAAKQYDAAAAHRPRHATDAGAWATFLRRLGEELHGGPAGGPTLAPQPPNVEAHVAAPVGTALPVEPEPGGSASTAPTPVDAGIPTGGVLL